MKTNNFFSSFAFLFGKKGSLANFIPSIRFGLKEPGVAKFIGRVDNITAEEFLEIISMKSGFNGTTFKEAKDKFMLSPAGIAHVNTKDKLSILTNISGREAVSLFDDKFFACEGEDAVTNLESVFSIAKPEQKRWLAEVIMLFFSQEVNKQHWTDDRAYMFEYVTSILIESINYYGEIISKDFAEYLVDSYGLRQAFRKNNNEAFIKVMDYATPEGIVHFFTEGSFDEKTILRLPTIESQLFEEDKPTLIAMVSALGCINEYVEGYLISTGELPNESIQKKFCFPKNFAALIKSKGISGVQILFPETFKESMPNLWGWIKDYNEITITSYGCSAEEWVKNYNKLTVTPDGCSAEEWKYALANDIIRNAYLANGGKLSQKDQLYLAQIGKYDAIATYRGK